MKKQLLFILSTVLLLQAGLIGYFYWPEHRANGATSIFFKGIGADDIAGFSITDDSGKELILKKTDKSWFVAANEDFPANPEKTESFLNKLLQLSSSHLVSRTSASHERFSLGDTAFERRITIRLKDDSSRTLLLGTEPNYRAAHVRMSGENEVYLVRDFAAWEAPTEASAWWEISYIRIAVHAIRGLSFENSHGTLSLTRTDENGWQIVGSDTAAEPDPEKLAELVDNAANVALEEYLGTEQKDEYGLDTPSASMTIETTDGVTTLLVGTRQEEPVGYVAKSSGVPYFVRVAPYEVDWLLELNAVIF